MRRVATTLARNGGRALGARSGMLAARQAARVSLVQPAPLAQLRAPVTLNMGVRAFSASSTFLPEAEVQERVIEVIKNFDKVDASKVKPEAHFINDLGLDSLDAVELVMAIEEEFVIEIPDDQAEKILTCDDAVKFVSQHPQAQ
ncbi:Acyl carrier protein [Hondaea fermentalgiana]|uniref:Acyl carrier protein n=1 Tax=Hondaea fermentalgiana TaxID=2315210 RepID=A0A2R5GA75_9STRA|nr:Acyl carrier protein [Hondaea fermentalgiana]|eukprot:GBG24594.1 Acyl carrier protein [Hondaea fermentalgiana]